MTGPVDPGGVVLVVAAMPDAHRVRARWGERFPDLLQAVVLSSHQAEKATLGLIVRRVYVDEAAWSGRDRRYLSLLQRLHRGLIRTGSVGVPVRLLPRLAANEMSQISISDLIYRPVNQ